VRRAAVALVLLAACSDSGPRWDAERALDRQPRRAPQIAVSPAPQPAPERAGATLLGAGDAPLASRQEGGATVFTAGDVSVRVVRGTPGTVAGLRPVAGTTPPGRAAALAAGRRLMAAFRMDATQWTPTVRDAGPTTSVQFEIDAALPVFATGGVVQPFVSLAVDARGVRSFTLTPVVLGYATVDVVSEAAAFGRLTRDGSYTGARLVLVDDGSGTIKPFWEFVTAAGDKRPVPAVLTP